MSFAIRKCEVACNTTTGVQTISPPGGDPGLGAPKAAVLFGVQLTADGAGANARSFVGVATPDGGDGYASFTSDDSAAVGVGGGGSDGSAAVIMHAAATTPTQDAAATVTAWNSDGSIGLDWSDAPGSAWRLHVVLFYGSDVTGAHAGEVAQTSGTGSKSVTGVGFQPDFVLRLAVAANTVTRSNGAHFDWCMFTAAASVAGGLATSEATTMANAVGERSGRALWSPSSSGSTLFESTLTSMDADGWTENYLTNAGAHRFVYLALRGPRVAVGVETKPTTASSKSTTAPGFLPSGGLMFSQGRAASTSFDTTSAECAKQSVGAWDDQGNEGSIWWGDDDGLGTSDTNMRTSATKALQFTSTFGGTVDSECDATPTATGFDLNWTSADATASEFGYVVFGAQSVTVPQTLSAAASGAASMVRQARLTRAAAAAGGATTTRRAGKVLAAAGAGSATMARRAGKILAASSTATASITSRFTRVVTLAASSTAAAAMIRQARLARAAGATGTASSSRTPAKILAAAGTGTSSIVRRVNLTRAAAGAGTATMIRQARLILAAGATGTATSSRVRTVVATLTATATGAATMTRRAGKVLAAAGAGTASSTRQVGKILAAAATGTATLAQLRVILRTLTANATGTATIVRQARLTRAVTGAGAATMTRLTAKTLAASATGTATLQALRAFLRTLTATATGTATMVRRANLTRAAAAAGTATVTRSIAKVLAASSTATATMIRRPAKTLTAAGAGAASITRRVGKVLTAAGAGAASIRRQVAKTLAAAAAGASSVRRLVAKVLAAAGAGTAELTSSGGAEPDVPAIVEATSSPRASIVSRVNRSIRVISRVRGVGVQSSDDESTEV